VNDRVDYDGIAESVRAGAFQWAREDVRLQPLTVRSVLLLALASACAAADDYNPKDLSEPNSKVMEEVDEMTDERSVGLFLRGAMADDSAYTVLAAMCKATREATAIGIADPTDEPPPSEQVLVRLDDEPAYRRVRPRFRAHPASVRQAPGARQQPHLPFRPRCGAVRHRGLPQALPRASRSPRSRCPTAAMTWRADTSATMRLRFYHNGT